MAIDPDPYRILGLPRGATLDEVKRAYRRLAKIHHPDAAGRGGAAPVPGDPGGLRAALTGAPPGGAWPPGQRRAQASVGGRPGPGDATRRAYGGRAGRRHPAAPRPAAPVGADRAASAGGTGGTAGERAGAGATGGPAGPATGNSGGAARAGSNGAGSGTGSSGATGAPGTAGRERPEPRSRLTRADAGALAPTPDCRGRSSPGQEGPPNPDAGRSRRTKRNKATLGSTSYDGADGPFEPDWRGASWYGTTSGTYWTLNPKEYADPRKHGPEYQARARRAVRARPPEVGATDAAAEAPSTAGTAPAGMGAGGPGQTPGPTGQPVSEPIADPVAGPTHTTSSWWDSTTGPAAAASGGGYPESGTIRRRGRRMGRRPSSAAGRGATTRPRQGSRGHPPGADR